jgi:hypothetical protein
VELRQAGPENIVKGYWEVNTAHFQRRIAVAPQVRQVDEIVSSIVEEEL